jgi:hypothetical protein
MAKTCSDGMPTAATLTVGPVWGQHNSDLKERRRVSAPARPPVDADHQGRSLRNVRQVRPQIANVTRQTGIKVTLESDQKRICSIGPKRKRSQAQASIYSSALPDLLGAAAERLRRAQPLA